MNKRSAVFVLLLMSFTMLMGTGKRVLFIGDSITDGGWGRSGGKPTPSEERNHKDLNHVYGHSFMFLCAAHYQSNYPEREYEFFNRGISGYTLKDLESRWQQDVIELNPDVLSVLVGVNDVYKHVSKNSDIPFDVAAWEETYRSLLDRTRQANPDIKLMLCTPFVAPTGKMSTSSAYSRTDSVIRECADAVRRLSETYNATLVPFDSLFEELLRQHPVDDGRHWIWDGIHPTAAGHHRMATLWIEKFEE